MSQTQLVPRPGPSTCDKRGADECDGPQMKIPRRIFIPKIVSYGTFYIIGYNGFIPPRNRGRVKSYFHLLQRDFPNGVKFARAYNGNSQSALKAAMAPGVHSVIYKFSVDDSAVVEYQRDDTKDMFQIGRSAECFIDFVVMDLDLTRHKVNSSVSRYACRVLVNRENHEDIRVFAAGFDESANMVLGEKAIKWHNGNVVDALTPNGILINHPHGDYWGGEAKPGTWRELSVVGKVYSLRPKHRDSNVRGALIKEETNVLRDGSLIDLCGATLLWRSAEGLKKSISKKELHDSLFKSIVEMQPESDTPKILIPQVKNQMKENSAPLVHFKCGHVESKLDPEAIPGYSRCPLCLQFGPTAELCVGVEPAFYVHDGPLLYAFNPCGHVANKKTVKYWSSIELPTRYMFEPMCPFCATVLEKPVGYVRLRSMDQH